MAEALAPEGSKPAAEKALTKIETPAAGTVAEVAALLNIAAATIAKTLFVLAKADEHGKQQLIALVVRGDHELNELKAEKLAGVASPLQFATDEQIRSLCGAGPGSVGPVGLNIRVVADRSAAHLADFVTGANKDGYHLSGVNWARDITEYEIADIRNIVAGDPSPRGAGKLIIKRGIEVGHIFQLGEKYSKALKAGVLNEEGKHQTMTMGCYGVGVSRIVAAAIEQNHDDFGIIWPDAIAPFQVALIPMNMHKSVRIAEVTEQLYQQLTEAGIEVLFDDRRERPGVMFADMELVGIPHTIVIGERNLDNQQVEYKNRRSGEKMMLDIANVITEIQQKLSR